MIKLVLFDIDGTLIRTDGAGVRAFGKVFETLFNATDHFEKLKFAGRTDFSLVREFFRVHGIPETASNFHEFFAAYVFWLDHLLEGTRAGKGLCPGVTGFLDGLEALPEPPVVGLLTGNVKLGAEIKLRHFGLWERFALGAFADDHEDRNRIAAAALGRGSRFLGRPLAGREVLVIGDTPHDISCGRAIGAKILAVATGGAVLTELQAQQPDWALPNLEAITPAEACA